MESNYGSSESNYGYGGYPERNYGGFLQKVVILVKVETLIDQHHHHFLQRVVSLVKVVILIGQHLHLAVKVH